MYTEQFLENEEVLFESSVENTEQVVKDEVLVISEPELGVVVDCVKLNVRRGADIKTAVLYEAKCGDELLVDLECSTEDWYNVCNNAGIVGYCMKKFIKLD